MSNNTVAERRFVMSVDVECDGIKNGHKPLAIGAVLYDTKSEIIIDKYEARIADLSGCTEWVVLNVIPAIQSITQLHGSSVELLTSFAKWYMQHKDDVVVIAHIPHPVETAMFLEMGKLGLIGEWDQPYPLIDVGAMLLTRNNNPLSVDDYRLDHCKSMQPNTEIGAHHPLYDAYQALSVFLHIIGLIRPKKVCREKPSITDVDRMDSVSRGMYYHWIKGTGM